MINRPTSCPFLLRVLLPVPPRSLASAINNQDRTLYLFQGDYIRHPLHELSSKYGVAGSDQVPLPARLDVLREHIRREIRKVCRVSLIPRRPQLLRSPLFLRLCVHTVARSAALRLLRYLRTALFSSPAIISLMRLILFFFFSFSFRCVEINLSSLPRRSPLASFCLE